MASVSTRNKGFSLLDIRVGEAVFVQAPLPARWRASLAQSKYAVLYSTRNANAVLKIDNGDIIKLQPGALVSLVSGQSHCLADCESSLNDDAASSINLFDSNQCEQQDNCADRVLIAARVPLTANPLPDVLSPIILVEADNKPLIERLQQLLNFAIATQTAPHSTQAPIGKRVAEILAIELTEYALECSSEDWLSRINDARLQRVIGVMRVNPGRPWSVSTLAAEARMSRSAFAARFRSNIGTAPMDYLRRCRIEAAIPLLTESDLPLYAIANRVGYQSPSAFARAFELIVGRSPGQYRRTNRVDPNEKYKQLRTL